MNKQLRLWCTLLLLAAFGATWGQTTYHLEQVTSVKVGGLYVFEQDGHVMNNVATDGALQTTTEYSIYGLTGNETYVWALVSVTGGFKMKNVSNGTSNNLLTNNSGTDVSLGSTGSVWVFNFQDDNTVLIQNTSNGNRYLGYTSSTSHVYKAYASSSLSSSTYPHAIKVYQLIETGSNDDLKGDVNGDGVVDVRDVTTLVNIILKKQQ